MSECVFCGILEGELSASFVYRDDRCAALMDIQPVNLGHVLVTPVRRAAYLADIDSDQAADLMRAGHAGSTNNSLRFSVHGFPADATHGMLDIGLREVSYG